MSGFCVRDEYHLRRLYILTWIGKIMLNFGIAFVAVSGTFADAFVLRILGVFAMLAGATMMVLNVFQVHVSYWHATKGAKEPVWLRWNTLIIIGAILLGCCVAFDVAGEVTTRARLSFAFLVTAAGTGVYGMIFFLLGSLHRVHDGIAEQAKLNAVAA